MVTFRVPYGHIFIDSINTARLSRTGGSLSHPLPTTTTTILLLEVKVIFTVVISNLSSCKESPEKLSEASTGLNVEVAKKAQKKKKSETAQVGSQLQRSLSILFFNTSSQYYH